MFFETSGPAYTARLLLSASQNNALNLKPFSHFTLGCTTADEQKQIASAFETLKTTHGPLALKGENVLNFGTEEKPLWVITLNIDPELRTLLSTLFDPMMCAERNGICYTWG